MITFTREMLDASPVATDLGAEAVGNAVDACLAALQACVSCADACLAEEQVGPLRRCVALSLNCTEVCDATMRILSRPFGSDHVVTHRLLRACVRACTTCGEECDKHAAHHRHCAVCARACRACAQACTVLLDEETFRELEKLAGG